MSYQAMLPKEILRQPVIVARQNNFIAFSSPEDLHIVLVRVEDLAGNTSVAEWSTRLQMYSAPVEIRECKSLSGLASLSLKNGIETLYNPGTPISNAEISWGSVDANTLTPEGSLDLAYGVVEATSKIERSDSQYFKEPWRDDVHGPALEAAKRILPHHGDKYGWVIGRPDGVCSVMSWGIAWPSLHAGRSVHVSRQTLVPQMEFSSKIFGPNNQMAIRPGTSHTVQWTMGSDPLKVNGDTPVNWERFTGPYGEGLSIRQWHAVQRHVWTGNIFEDVQEENVSFVEHEVLKKLSLSRAAVRVHVQGLGKGTPPPLKMDFDDSCDATEVATWEMNRTQIW